MLAAAGGLSLGLSLLSAIALGCRSRPSARSTRSCWPPAGAAGPLTPVAMVWAIGFPVVRVMHAALISVYAGEAVAVPHGWVDFIVYNILPERALRDRVLVAARELRPALVVAHRAIATRWPRST